MAELERIRGERAAEVRARGGGGHLPPGCMCCWLLSCLHWRSQVVSSLTRTLFHVCSQAERRAAVEEARRMEEEEDAL